METITDINSENDLQTHIDTHDTAIINFHADWCPPCITMELFFEELADDPEFQTPILRVDTEKQPDIVDSYNVRSNPTTIFMKNGTEHRRETEMLDKKEIKTIINSL